MTNKQRILESAVTLLKDAPQGIRYSVLVRKIQEILPDVPLNTVHGNIWNLEIRRPEDVCKPAKGLFLHTKYKEVAPPEETKVALIEKIKEESFYGPFADWLINELEECTKAIAVGGNKFRDKWGTPDVVGIREPKKSDIIQFPTEIVCAEIKLDSFGLITAFGQACAYRLFSHKSYIVIPKLSPEDDIARLDTLARIFGIGLILFDPSQPKAPDFDIRVRATKHDPDMFYVNKIMKEIEDQLFG